MTHLSLSLRLVAVIVCAMLICAAPVSAFASGGGEESTAPPPEFEYLELKTLTLPVITDRGITQQVSMIVSLELPYGEKAGVEAMTPRLADAFLQDLYGAFSANHDLMAGNVINVQAVKNRLTAVTTRVLGPEKVHDVLLQVVHQRPMPM